MDTFICKHKKKKWVGQIFSFINHGTHFEMMIQAPSNIMVLFARSSRGYFACMPDFGAGCHLAQLNDIYWNAEKLIPVLGVVNGTTVAFALLYLHKELKYPEF